MKCAIMLFLGLSLAKPAHAKSASKKCATATEKTTCGLKVMESTVECDKKEGLKTIYTVCDDGHEDHFLFLKQEGGECFDPCFNEETFCRVNLSGAMGGWVYGQIIEGCCVKIDQ